MSSLVDPALRERVRGLATPIAAGLGRLGLSPNHLSLIGFLVAVVAAVAAAGQGWLAAGVLVIVGGLFDLLDGALARATGRASRLGAFLDSVFDRAGEGAVYVGIVVGCQAAGLGEGVVLAAAAMAAAFMVSYVRAKSESLGFTPGSRMAAIGLAPREVRLVILAVGLVGAGSLPAGPSFGEGFVGAGGAAYPPAWLALDGALGLIAVLATITAVQRIVHVVRQSGQST